jgi:hypothetical protein
MLQKEVDGLEGKLEALLQKWQPAQARSVGSIKGISKRATGMLIIFTQGFKNIYNHQECALHVRHECDKNQCGLQSSL